MKRNRRIIGVLIAISALLAVALTLLFAVEREERIDLLFAVNGDDYDRAAYYNFQQTLAANVKVHMEKLADLGPVQLKRYDAIYLDHQLKRTETLQKSVDKLMSYVHQGGHLFLDNDVAEYFPASFLGGTQWIEIGTPEKFEFAYPDVDPNLEGIQRVFQLFTDNFLAHSGMESMPGFYWGFGLVTDTAEPLVVLNGTPIMTLNRYGKGTVMLGSTFLPNHYYITGFDLESGMDEKKGFANKVKQAAEQYPAQPGMTYFRFKQDKQPLEPYFNFAFASANYLFRNEYLKFVSKETLGYSISKTYGPYGRPAMAYQNHFEVLSAFGKKEGILWAELLKEYSQIPSFSLVRAAYDWAVWYEDVTVHLNVGTQEAPEFVGQYANSFYGSGVRLALSGGKPLTLAQYPNAASLGDPIKEPYRAYPALADLDGDGRVDLIAGSADGTVHWFRNLGPSAEAYANQPLPDPQLTPPDLFAEGVPIMAGGKPLQLPDGYAAPAAADLDGDGLADLIIGDKAGHVWVVYQQVATDGSTPVFTEPVRLAAGGEAVQVSSYAAPAIGDVNGDGIPDLVVGTGGGSVMGYMGYRNGAALAFQAGERLFQTGLAFVAPSVRDLNGDGRNDLAVGSQEGDVRVYIRTDAGFEPKGPIPGQRLNQVGTSALVGGHNSVPLWYDINGDGRDDLIVGQLEFGLPIPLDDPSFPYKEELAEFIQYAKDHYLNLYPHLFVHGYTSHEQEQEEIRLHREMFAKLGIPWGNTGTNQHTWRTVNTDPTQSFRNQSLAGLWYNFGFRPANNPLDPQYGHDYIWGVPFLLQADGLETPMLLSTPSYLLRLEGEQYPTEDLYRTYTALDLPIVYFDHIENKLPGKAEQVLKYVKYLDEIRTEYDYNFMTEEQMARSILASLTSRITVKQTWAQYVWTKLQDWFGNGSHLSLTIAADTSQVPEQAGSYREAVGVAIEPGKKYKDQPLRVDSELFLEQGSTLYTGLGQPVTLTIGEKEASFHLLRSNVPYQLTREGDTIRIDLKENGMQQIKLYSPVPLDIKGKDLTLISVLGDKHFLYTITHYGAQTSIVLQPNP